MIKQALTAFVVLLVLVNISCQERYSNMDLRGTFETRDSRAL